MPLFLQTPTPPAEETYPASGAPEDQLRFLLRYALRAPSGHNTQPWRFEVADGHVDLYADTTRALPVIDPGNRELVMSCGAALLHLRLALRRVGQNDRLQTFPDPARPDLLARVGPDGPTRATPEEERLFDAIATRHTNRLPFADRALPKTLPPALEEAARAENARLRTINGETERQTLLDLIAEGDRQLAASPEFRREAAGWLHAEPGSGVTSFPVDLGAMLAYTGAFAQTTDTGALWAAQDRELAGGAAALVVLETEGDDAAAWLAAGQALARVLLRASAEGVAATFLNAPVQAPALRAGLRDLLGGSGFPQIVLGLGYSVPAAATPRRALDDVLR